MENRTEDFFKNYLKKIPNAQLKQFYDDVEWTPFPVLVIKEYQSRFQAKNRKDVLEKLKIQAEIAKERTSIVKGKIKSKGRSLTEKTKNKMFNPKKNLELLEKLAELKRKGIITNKEFQKKKKELLERV